MMNGHRLIGDASGLKLCARKSQKASRYCSLRSCCVVVPVEEVERKIFGKKMECLLVGHFSFRIFGKSQRFYN